MRARTVSASARRSSRQRWQSRRSAGTPTRSPPLGAHCGKADPVVDAVPSRSSATARAVFARRGYRAYWAARFFASFAVQIVSVSVGWQVYDITRNPLDLGIVGLVQFLPSLALVLVTGSVADRFDRRRIFAACLAA